MTSSEATSAAAQAATIAVVNADDLGLSRGVNEGVVEAHRRGIVTSASLMTNLDGFDDAIAAIRAHPRLGVGVHLTLSCGRPLTALPAPLVDAAGRFSRVAVVLAAVALRPVLRAAIRAELAAQLERARAAGVEVTHLDTHHNLHLFAPLGRMVREIADASGIRWVRFRDQRPLDGVALAAGPGGRARNRAKLALAALLCPVPRAPRGRYVFGAPQLEASSSEAALASALAALRPGVTEIACHPGRPDAVAAALDPRNRTRECELHALTAPRIAALVAERGIRLASYAELDRT